MRRRTEQKSEIYLRSALYFYVYKIDAPSISCTVPFGNTTVTFVKVNDVSIYSKPGTKSVDIVSVGFNKNVLFDKLIC